MNTPASAQTYGPLQRLRKSKNPQRELEFGAGLDESSKIVQEREFPDVQTNARIEKTITDVGCHHQWKYRECLVAQFKDGTNAVCVKCLNLGKICSQTLDKEEKN